jgi:hypothetical protein
VALEPKFTENSDVNFAAFVVGSKQPRAVTPAGHTQVFVTESYVVATVAFGHPYVGQEKHTPFSVGCGNDPEGHV